MNEIKQTTSEVPSPKTEAPAKQTEPNWDKLTDKFKAIEDYLASLVGKQGQNPYLWAKKNKFAEVKEQLDAKDIACVTVISVWPAQPDCTVKSAGPKQIVSEQKSVIRARQEIKIPVIRK